MKLISIVIALLCGTALAQTGNDIAKAVDQRKTPADMQADLKMILTNKKGKTRINELRTITKDGSEKQIIWFYEPRDDKGVAFLKIEHEERDDEMRLWLPAFKKVRRISSGKKGDSFMGSDMSYEDMTSRELEEYTYELTGEEKLDEQLCYRLVVTPKKDTDTEYTKHIEWITKDRFLVLKSESYDKSGNLKKIRTVTYSRMDEYDILNRVFVENVQKDHSTELTFQHILLDQGVDDDLFQEKNLKRLPAR